MVPSPRLRLHPKKRLSLILGSLCVPANPFLTKPGEALAQPAENQFFRLNQVLTLELVNLLILVLWQTSNVFH